MKADSDMPELGWSQLIWIVGAIGAVVVIFTN